MTKPPISDLESSDPYRVRPADEGGMYLLLPRDEHLLPMLPEKIERVVIALQGQGGESAHALADNDRYQYEKPNDRP